MNHALLLCTLATAALITLLVSCNHELVTSPKSDVTIIDQYSSTAGSCDFYDDFETGSFSEEWEVRHVCSSSEPSCPPADAELTRVVSIANPAPNSAGQYAAKVVGEGWRRNYDPNGVLSHDLGGVVKTASFEAWMKWTSWRDLDNPAGPGWAYVDVYIGFDPFDGYQFWLWSPTSAYKSPGSTTWSHSLPDKTWTRIRIEYDRDLNNGTHRFYEDGDLKLTLPNHGQSVTSFAAYARALYDRHIEYLLDDVCINYELVTQVIDVEIDIKPGSDDNCVNNDGRGVIPVAIFGRDDFDVRTIDPASVELEGMGVAYRGKSYMAHYEELNGDAFEDLNLKIEDVDGAFGEGVDTAELTGELYDGTRVRGADNVCIVPPTN